MTVKLQFTLRIYTKENRLTNIFVNVNCFFFPENSAEGCSCSLVLWVTYGMAVVAHDLICHISRNLFEEKKILK